VQRQTVILCIDDNRTGLSIRKLLLESKGFVVRTASDGPSGLQVASREAIDAVILDYGMPEMDGEEVAKRLRAVRPEMPILLLSGFRGLIPESLLAIVDGFVEKGQSAELLLSEVERIAGSGINNGVEGRKRA
jgi:CheY-like chemotaxis protein